MNESRKLRLTDARKLIVLMTIVVMFCGLLFSRVLLSLGMVVFAATCLVHQDIINQVKCFVSSPFLWAMSFLFLVVLISGIWSEDISRWSQVLRIKLPLVVLPVCFAGINYFTYRDWRNVALAFLIVVTAGAGWSLWQYFQDITSVQAAYLKAQTMETPLGNDHVRFSLLVAIATLTSAFLLVSSKPKLKRAIVIGLLAITLVMVIYLHVLAARTGLICFYIGLVTFIFWLLRRPNNKLRYAWLLTLLLAFPLISWFVFPTFKNRISYFRYDFSSVKSDVYRGGSNDGNRLRSIKTGWELQNTHPLAGVGFGDIKKETDSIYEKKYPQIMDADRILPSSEWIMYGAGAGWPGFILFLFVMLVPFFVKITTNKVAWWLLNIFMALSYLFDIGLEVQYGVFVHAFILLWWYKWLQTAPG